jgi:hypothetical protein
MAGLESGEYLPAWTVGFMSYAPDNSDNFNTELLLNPKYSAFANYIKAAAVYRCPSDRSTALWNERPRLRLRSYSYNRDFYATALTGANGFVLASLVQKPSTAMTFIEEHED